MIILTCWHLFFIEIRWFVPYWYTNIHQYQICFNYILVHEPPTIAKDWHTWKKVLLWDSIDINALALIHRKVYFDVKIAICGVYITLEFRFHDHPCILTSTMNRTASLCSFWHTQCWRVKGDSLSQSSSLPTSRGGTGCGSSSSSVLLPANLKNDCQVIGPVTLIAFGSHKLKQIREISCR